MKELDSRTGKLIEKFLIYGYILQATEGKRAGTESSRHGGGRSWVKAIDIKVSIKNRAAREKSNCRALVDEVQLGELPDERYLCFATCQSLTRSLEI